MKKLFITLVAAIVAATATFAQSTLVATLTHGENVTMYYGTYALRDAYDDAASGDVINLSGGGFQAVDINKGITLRGTGANETLPTSIVGSIIVDIPANDANRFTMEGVIGASINLTNSSKNPYILKCRFSYAYIYGEVKNAMFVNCKVTDGGYISNSSTAQFVNCYVNNFYNNTPREAAASFINCVICPSDGYYTSNMGSFQLMNCIIYNNSSYDYSSLPNTTIASNCVAVSSNTNSDIFNNSQVNPNCSHATFAEVFKDFKGEYTDAQTFELTSTAKAKYLGIDGTQAGLYGGMMPFTLTPSYPRITKMNVASKTTADGKLSVEIEVSAAQ